MVVPCPQAQGSGQQAGFGSILDRIPMPALSPRSQWNAFSNVPWFFPLGDQHLISRFCGIWQDHRDPYHLTERRSGAMHVSEELGIHPPGKERSR